MVKYIIDVNLPYYFSLWNSDEYIHQIDIDAQSEDATIWEYAKQHNLTIITKDSDFSNRILINEPPPKVIHIKFGNMKMKDFYQKINTIWVEVIAMSENHKLTNVYNDEIEGIS